MSEAVYVLCMLTSLFCAFLLFRSHRAARSTFLLWCTLGFVGLALANAFLVLDLLVFRQHDMRLIRASITFVSGLAMAAGLVWESR